MKRIVFPALAALMLTAGCTKKPAQATVEINTIDTTVADWDQTSVPMPMIVRYDYADFEEYEVSARYPFHLFDSQSDSALYAPVADTYHILYRDGQSKPVAIKAKGLQVGKEWGSIINGRYEYCMNGYLFDFEEEVGEDSFCGFSFSDSFLKSHEVLQLKYPQTPAPRYLLDSIEARYGNSVRSSIITATTLDEKVTTYSVQMEPKDGKCLGMLILKEQDQMYIYEDWCEAYDEYSAWHVDDGGEYAGCSPCVITHSGKGYDIFYCEGSPESLTFGALLLRNGKFDDYQFACYYNHVDYVPSPDPVALPEDAVLQAECDGYRVWVRTEAEPTEDNPAGVYSVYYSNPDETDVYKVVMSGVNPNASWEGGCWVEASDVLTAEKVFLVKDASDDTYYLILEGCPDLRNVCDYVVSLPLYSIEPMFHQITANSGFQGVDEKSNLLMFHNYGYYEEGGRYTVCRYLDFSFDMVKEEPVEE